MNNFKIKYLIADEYIASILKGESFDLNIISKKLKINNSVIQTLSLNPYLNYS